MNTASRYSDAEITIYHGGRAAYCATLEAQISALESELASGFTDDIAAQYAPTGDAELDVIFGSEPPEQRWRDSITRKLAAIRAALEANRA